MKNLRLIHVLLYAGAIAAIGCIAGCKRPSTRALDEVVRKVNSIAPKMVDDSLLLESAHVASSAKITLTYRFMSVRVADISAELWEREVKPSMDRQIVRSELTEAKALPKEGTRVGYRYLDRDGQLIAELVVTEKGIFCEIPIEPNKAPEPTTTSVTPPAAQESRQP